MPELIGKLSRGLPMLVPAFDTCNKKNATQDYWREVGPRLQYYRGICCTRKHHQLSRIPGQHRHSRAEYRGRVLDFTQLEIDSGIHRSFAARVLVDTRARVYNILREAVIQPVTSRTNGKCTVRRVNR